MTASIDLGPLAETAHRYLLAVQHIERAAGDAEDAWRLLPAAIDSPGTQIAVGRYTGPAHQLSTGLLLAAEALVTALESAVVPLRYLEAQAAAFPDDPSWQARAAASETDCAATIAGIHGGEAGSVALQCPVPAPLGTHPRHLMPVPVGLDWPPQVAPRGRWQLV